MSDIQIGLRRPEVKFIAADNAPSAEDAVNTLVPDLAGRYALKGFKKDPYNPESKVLLDTAAEPPVLHLKNALTRTVHGFIDTETGEFKPYGGHVSEFPHTATGEYTGPGSILEIS